MRALADENFPRAAILELRRRGWDVVAIQEWRPSMTDANVAAKAREDGRVLLTFDKDFGEFWLADATSSSGTVLFRLPRLSATETADRIVDALTSRTHWSGGFWVVDADRVRARKS